jgi:hypothetical protein
MATMMNHTGPLYVVVRSACRTIVDDDAPLLGAFRLSTSNSDIPVHVMMSAPSQVGVSNPGHDSKTIEPTTKTGSKLASADDCESDDSTTMEGSGFPSVSGSDLETFDPTTSAKEDATLTDLVDHSLPSVGSAQHFQDQCTPCTLFYKNTCRFGSGCTFCHFEHVIKARPNKRARGRAKAYSARIKASGEEPSGDA